MISNEFPQDKEYELSLLLKGDPEFTDLIEYLDAYIKIVLERYEMPRETYNSFYHALREDIPIAAKKYLQGNARKMDYKFSAYFSWYVSERLNRSSKLRRQ